MSKKFDPLLFDGFGDKKDRIWNNALYAILAYNAAFSVPIGLYILKGIIEKWYYYDCFVISYFIFILNFIFVFGIWFYVHILIFKHTRKNKHIDSSKAILVCKYQGNFINYCAWALGFLCVFILYLVCFVLFIFVQPFIVPVLMHIYLSKPFLLKRILLFDDCVILEYRIFGNIKLNRDNLALMTVPRASKNLAFVRPQLFDKAKYPHILANFCVRFNPLGLENIHKLRQELDFKLGYSPYEMTKNKYVIANTFDLNCLKIYL